MLWFILLLFLSPGAVAAPTDCPGRFRVLRSVEDSEVKWRQFETYIWPRVVKNHDTDAQLIARFQRSQQFRRYLDDAGLAQQFAANEPVQQVELIKRFLFDYIVTLSDEPLAAFQDHLLRRSLAVRGVRVAPGQSAYERLAEISAANRERVLNGRVYRSSPAMQEAEAAVEAMPLVFLHRTRNLQEPPALPILSPIAIDRLGIQGIDSMGRNMRPNATFGAYSNFPFHFHIGSANNVYFNVDYGGPTSANQIYGNFGLQLVNDYARERAWVSPWIMNSGEVAEPVHLARHGQRGGPEASAEMRGLLEQLDSEDFATRQQAAARLRDLRRHLHQFDFTVPDYERLIRELLLLALQDLQQAAPAEYAEALDVLQNGRALLKANLIKRLVLEPNNLPMRFELRVPGAVPHDQVEVVPLR